MRQTAWYSKPRPIFADALTVVRRSLWRAISSGCASQYRLQMAQGLDLPQFSFGGSPAHGVATYFSPTPIAAIKAIACELPFKLQLPFSHLSLPEFQDYLIKQEVVEHISVVIFHAKA